MLRPESQREAMLWPESRREAMLQPESRREAMLHLTISIDEGVCAPSEISSPSEVLATVGCDASALTPLTISNV